MWKIIVGSRDGFPLIAFVCIWMHLASFVPTGNSLFSTRLYAGWDGTEEVLIEGELRRLLSSIEVPKDLRKTNLLVVAVAREQIRTPRLFMPGFLIKKPRCPDPKSANQWLRKTPQRKLQRNCFGPLLVQVNNARRKANGCLFSGLYPMNLRVYSAGASMREPLLGFGLATQEPNRSVQD